MFSNLSQLTFRIAGSYVKNMFHFIRNWQTIFFPKWLYHYILTSNVWEYRCRTFLPISLLHFSHSSECVVILIMILICISIITNDVHFFMWLSVYLLSWSVQIFSPFLIELLMILLLSCKHTLYILNTSPWSDICIVNIFPQFMACFFIFIWRAVYSKNSFNFYKLQFIIILFYD